MAIQHQHCPRLYQYYLSRVGTVGRGPAFNPLTALPATIHNQSAAMSALLRFFQAITIIFTPLAIYTGLSAILQPRAFAKQFGIPLSPLSGGGKGKGTADNGVEQAYVSLLGARQLGTGVILLIFASLGKWEEAAIVLSVIGVVVAGMDGLYIARSGPGRIGAGAFHAVPGAGVALLAFRVWCTGAAR